MANSSVAGTAKAAVMLLLFCFCSNIAIWLVPAANAQTTRATVKPNAALLSYVRSLNKADAIKFFVDSLERRGHHNFKLPDSNMSHYLRDASAVFEATLLDDVGCKPVPQVVEIPPVENAVTYPHCVMLNRCSDCCSTPLHVCGPKFNTSETWRLQVLRFYSSNDIDQLEPKYESVSLEVHKACECQCRIKATDCNPRVHTYDADNCQCNCKDTTSSRQCIGNRRWSHDSCSCECYLRPESCPAGSLFDSTNCQCVTNQGCNRNVIQPVLTTTTQQTTRDPCAHLSCPPQYKGVLTGTTCRCTFSRP